MEWYDIVLIVLLTFIVVSIISNVFIGYGASKRIFNKVEIKNIYKLSNKSLYYKYQPKLIQGIEWYNTIQKKEIYIINNRNIKLFGKLTKQNTKEKPNGIIFFHGWNDSGENEISCFGIPLLYKEGYDILIVDEEAHGKSEGDKSTIGLLEHKDVLLWVDKVNEIYNNNCNIILSGLSMGANMVMLSADKPMKNVKAIIENCGFTNLYEELKFLFISKTKISILIIGFVNFFIKLKYKVSLKHFDARKTLENSLYPVLFIHGKKDQIVPYKMVYELYNKCKTEKEILVVDEAVHLVSSIVNEKEFNKLMLNFLNKHLRDS